MRPEALTRTLVHVQAHLDEDLSLERLAGHAGLSPFHFQRAFRAEVGETPRAYVERLRLERAAFRLLSHEGSVLDVALECGFTGHDTFTRAFRRHFGRTPSEHRAAGTRARGARASNPRACGSAGGRGYELSRPRLVRTQPMEIAFLRHAGPYAQVPAALWDELAGFARSRGLPEPDLLLGIGHDAPEVTPAGKLRFDAAIPVARETPAAGRIGRATLAAADWALTTHSGPYASLPVAYSAIFAGASALRGARVVGLPVLEIYRTTRIRPELAIQHTDVYVPVELDGGT